MTLNEMRERLAAKYPGRTLNVEASCWIFARAHDAARRETVFRGVVFAADGIKVEASTDNELSLEAVETALAGMMGSPPRPAGDALAEAETESC